MAVVDPIADMLTRIRNAQMALNRIVQIPKSKVKLSIAQILKSEGYIENISETDRDFVIRLKYLDGKPVIAGLKRISKSGCRKYVSVDDIPMVQNGLGINILSTSNGILEGNQAHQERVGGELLCQIW